MKKYFLAIFITGLISTGIHAQKAAKVVFGELGGPGLASVNYDMRFGKKEDGFGFRIGTGFSVDRDVKNILFPLGINFITSKDNRNYLEAGAGVTIVSTDRSNSNNDESPFSSTFGHLNIGYRLQPKEGGFFFRAAINPVYGNGIFWPYYGGVGLGYKF